MNFITYRISRSAGLLVVLLAILSLCAGKGLAQGLNRVLRFDLSQTNGAASDSTIDLRDTSFTVEFWAKRDRKDNDDFVVFSGTTETDKGLHIGFRKEGQFTFAFWNDDLDVNFADPSLMWHHWACVYDRQANQRFIYLDGTLVKSDTPRGDYIGTPSRLELGGSANTAFGAKFKGRLDDVRVWTVVRSRFEVAANQGLGSLDPATPGLKYYWNFEVVSGANVVSVSPVTGKLSIPGAGVQVVVDEFPAFASTFGGVDRQYYETVVDNFSGTNATPEGVTFLSNSTLGSVGPSRAQMGIVSNSLALPLRLTRYYATSNANWALRLTAAGIKGQVNMVRFPVIRANDDNAINEFDAGFDFVLWSPPMIEVASVGASLTTNSYRPFSSPAGDGISFNFGDLTPGAPQAGLAKGFTINITSDDNGLGDNTRQYVRVYSDGVKVAESNIPNLYSTELTGVWRLRATVSAQGLAAVRLYRLDANRVPTADKYVICENVPLSWTPKDAWTFGLGGRSVNNTEEALVDSVSIYAGRRVVSSTGVVFATGTVVRPLSADLSLRFIASPTNLFRTNAVMGTVDVGRVTDVRPDFDRGTNYLLPLAGAMSFNGVQDGLRLPPITAFNDGAFTIEAWVYPRSVNKFARILHASASTITGDSLPADNHGGVILALDDGNLATRGIPALYLYGKDQSLESALDSDTPIPLNQWVHLAAVVDGTTARMYMNGRLVASRHDMVLPPSLDRNVALLGSSPWKYGDLANVVIDEVRIWNTALPQAQIQSWMFREVQPRHPSFARLKNYWRFNDPTLAVVDEVTRATTSVFGTAPTQVGFGPPIDGSRVVTFAPTVPGATYAYRTYFVNQLQTTTTSFTTPLPGINPLASRVIPEDAGLQTIALGGIAYGGPDSNSVPPPGASPLLVTATSDNPGLIPPSLISCIYTNQDTEGTLVFASAPNAFGSARLTVTVSYTYAGGTKTASSETSFNVRVDPVNDLPSGGYGAALRLAGGQQVVIPQVGSRFDGALDEMTLSSWIQWQLPAMGKSVRLLGFPSDADLSVRLTTPSDGSHDLKFTFGGATAMYAPSSGNELSDGVWEHWAFLASRSENYVRILRNGVVVAQVPFVGAINPGPVDLTLGFSAGAPGSALGSSQWSEFQLWKSARDPAVVQQTMSSPLVGNDADLMIYFRFNEGVSPGSVFVKDWARSLTAPNQWGAQDASVTGISPGASADFQPSSAFVRNGQSIRIPANEGTPTLLYLAGFDVETPLTNLVFTIVTPPAHGILTNQFSGSKSPYWVYVANRPASSYNNQDQFVYRITDAQGGISERTVYLSVDEINYDPVISLIPNLSVLQDSSNSVPFVIYDPNPGDIPGLAERLVFKSSDRQLLDPATSFVVRVTSQTNVVLTLVPVPDQHGTVDVTVKLTDGRGGSAQALFTVRVEPPPYYAVMDLGEREILSGFASSAFGLNDAGIVVGAGSRDVLGGQRGFLSAFGSEGWVSYAFNGLAGVANDVRAINNMGQVVGTSDPTGAGVFKGYIASTASTNELGSLGGAGATPLAVNDNGFVTGLSRIAPNYHAFRYQGSLVDIHSALGIAGSTSSAGWAVNASNIIAGTAWSSTATNAFVYDGISTRLLPALPGAKNSAAYGLNALSYAVGYSTSPDSPFRAVIWDAAGQVSSLGALHPQGSSVAMAINDFGQVVGESRIPGDSDPHAFIYTSGTLYDLNLTQPEENRWKLTSAVAINRSGMIVGTGIDPRSRQRGYLALPGNIIGRPVVRPQGAVARAPEIEVLAPANVTVADAFLWNSFQRRLYAVRPCLARLKWFTSTNDFTGTGSNIVAVTDRIVVISTNMWPRNPTVHVATVPVNVEPTDGDLPATYQALLYSNTASSVNSGLNESSETNVVVDSATKLFNATSPGYSVLHYLRKGYAASATIENSPSYLDVVRTVEWDRQPFNDPTPRPWPVGVTLGHTNHFDFGNRTGWVLRENSFYDAVGPDAAYQRQARTGAIIPVNAPDLKAPADKIPAETNDFVVVWFRTNAIGVPWGNLAIHYGLQWPETTTNVIVIASGLGTGPLDPLIYPDQRIYNQPDPKLPGYNPNEEHALFAPSSNGQALFALRSDLNDIKYLSRPFALLKYRDPVLGQWRITPYKVVATNDQYRFTAQAEAGRELQPFTPLNVLQTCDSSKYTSGPGWRDYNSRIYAMAAGPNGTGTNIVVQWYYPLQPGFFWDWDLSGTPKAPIGSCVALLNRLQGGSMDSNPPVDFVFQIRWPDAPPVLQTGQTLLNSVSDAYGRGLPDVFKMANAQIIYDDVAGTNQNAIQHLAKFYDPISVRTANGVSLPQSGGVETVNRNGKIYFPQLPPSLASRLYYDPNNRSLNFQGIYDTTQSADAPILLPNVMSSRDLARVLSLTDQGSSLDRIAWGTSVNLLYNFTRNPNGVATGPTCVADEAVRVGLDWTKSTYIVSDADYARYGQPGQPTLREALGFGPCTQPFASLTISKVTNTVIVGGVATTRIVTYYKDTYERTGVGPQQFGGGPKALTAGDGDVPPAQPMPLKMLRYNGSNTLVQTTAPLDLSGGSFTIEFWAKLASTAASGRAETVVSLGAPSAAGELRIGWLPAGQFAFDLGTNASLSWFRTAGTERPGGWNHFACVFDATRDNGTQSVFRNGLLLIQRTNVFEDRTTAFVGSGRLSVGGGNNNYFRGDLDEFRVWESARSQAEILRDMRKRLGGAFEDLDILWHFDEGLGSTTANEARGYEKLYAGVVSGAPSWVDSDAPAAIPPRFVTIAENNDSNLPGLPVNLKVIQVDDGPYVGTLKTIDPGNVFDERLTIRHSSDFGADPDRIEFEWYYRPIANGVKATDLPVVNVDGTVRLGGWIFMGRSTGKGINEVTLGEGGESSLLALADNFIVGRYRGYNKNGVETNVWSDWIGQEPGRAKLTAGWVSRVLGGLNAFDVRSSNFHTDPINTFSSMLVQAGRRYEGDIAFSVTPENLNSLGLIESYETVLRRAANLSINGAPRVDFDPANKAILRVATSLSDLYTLLGNEAYADAQDPTIGFGTVSATAGSGIPSIYGSLASSIFCFQNQVPSLLDEELALLRGRSDEADTVSVAPAYNRLYWNFTQGDGEVAYQQNYNIKDVNNDGFINAADARILYPQGHGDAWGHYLTALTGYYSLLQNPYFTWVSRPGNINVAGASVSVDFLDERKFAQAAAYKAQVGVEIVNSTYRRDYVDDPNGQWQGYKDTDSDRAWGVTEWARRASVGAYFDWVTANTLLPSTDPDPSHTGIFKIDRQTVLEISSIPPLSDQIQENLDRSDLGLNPLGIAAETVPFDIDPAQVTAGKTHFEQIYSRAQGAMNNAVAVWNDANRASQLIRQNQDSIQQFGKNVQDQDRDYKNRLIEIFGYPYAGDIGAGRTYASGYDGPDLYHYNYLDSANLGESSRSITQTLSVKFQPFQKGLSKFGFTYQGDGTVNLLNETNTGPNSILTIDFPLTANDWAFVAPTGWGNRRAPGEIQNALSDLLQNQARLRRCLIQHDNAIKDIENQAKLIEARYDLREDEQLISRNRKATIGSLAASIVAETVAAKALRRSSETAAKLKLAAASALPTVQGLAVDALAPARGALAAAAVVLESTANLTATAIEGTAQITEKIGIPVAEGVFQGQLNDKRYGYEQKQMLLRLDELIRAEQPLRAEAQQLSEVIRQNVGRFRSAVAAGERLLDQRRAFAVKAASETSQSRYQDMTFRVFRNDALQKYRATLDLAQTYVFLAAKAYDYETCLLGTDSRAGRTFLTDIISQRAIGQVVDGNPVVGPPGLADSLARMGQNFQVLKSQLGFNNPETETGRFSLRNELYRLNVSSDQEWQNELRRNIVSNVWDVPEFRRYCRPFAPESAGPQPALVLRFPTTMVFGRNYFGWPLGGGDSAYDSSRFATRIRSVGVWFSNYNGSGLSFTPRVYLVPVGMDVLRPPGGDDFSTRQWRVVDQALPVPFALGSGTFQKNTFLPVVDSLGGVLAQQRQFSSFRAYHDAGNFDPSQVILDSRLVGRSVWNTDWMLIVPGGTLLNNPDAGLDGFVASVKDIKLFFQTYSYSGN